jgi:hypothetical protein
LVSKRTGIIIAIIAAAILSTLIVYALGYLRRVDRCRNGQRKRTAPGLHRVLFGLTAALLVGW